MPQTRRGLIIREILLLAVVGGPRLMRQAARSETQAGGARNGFAFAEIVTYLCSLFVVGTAAVSWYYLEPRSIGFAAAIACLSYAGWNLAVLFLGFGIGFDKSTLPSQPVTRVTKIVLFTLTSTLLLSGPTMLIILWHHSLS